MTTAWSSAPTPAGDVRIPAWLDLTALAAVDDRDETWRPAARCLVDDESTVAVRARWAIFYPDKPRPVRADYDDADRYCQSCPVRLECLEAHLYDSHAYAGGTTPADRRRIRRALRAQRVAAA